MSLWHRQKHACHLTPGLHQLSCPSTTVLNIDEYQGVLLKDRTSQRSHAPLRWATTGEEQPAGSAGALGPLVQEQTSHCTGEAGGSVPDVLLGSTVRPIHRSCSGLELGLAHRLPASGGLGNGLASCYRL